MNDGKQSTPAGELERQICSATEPKNEREWWAHHEIARLLEISRLRAELLEASKAALTAERAKVERLRGALIDANDICRSAFTIANRIATEFSTIEFNTMFGAFAAKAKESLCRQHTVIHETGGYPRAAIGVETGEV